MMDQVKEYEPRVGTAALCRGLGLSRATVYRLRAPKMDVPCAPRPTPSHALSEDERQAILDLLHGQRFVDRPPADVVATLLDANHVPDS
jgi:putative transposase